QCRQAIVLSLQPVVLDRHVLAFDVAGFIEAFAKPGHVARVGIGRPGSDEPDHRQRRLLRARRERPSRYTAADKCDEFPPPHGGLPQGQGSRTKYSRSWSGFGGLHRKKKRKKVWPEPYGRAGLAKRRSVISITDAGEMPVYSNSQELDRDGPDAFPFLALARIRSSRSCGAANRRRVYSCACVGHLNRRLEWQRHDFSPGKLQTMP